MNKGHYSREKERKLGITCSYEELFIGRRMSWEGGEVCGGDCPLALSVQILKSTYSIGPVM